MTTRIELRPGRWIGPDDPTYVVAEVGANFDGSLAKAKRLVDLAVESGCDAVKFQTFTAEGLLNKASFTMRDAHQATWKASPWDTYKAAEFPEAWHAEVADHARSRGIDFFSSPYGPEALALLKKLGSDVVKIGSGEIDNVPFLRDCAASGMGVLVACGASTLSDVDLALATLRGAGASRIVLLQCTTSYPTPFDQVHLRAMVALGATFGVPVGISDHTPGLVVPLAAVALGGRVVEKHFTDDRRNAGPDHPHSLEPDEMKALVQGVRAVEAALGDPVKRIYPAEEKTKILQRRSLHALRDIAVGETFTPANVGARRPAVGLPPPFLDRVLGRKAAVAIAKGTPLTWGHL